MFNSWVSAVLSTGPPIIFAGYPQLSKNTKNIGNPIPFYSKLEKTSNVIGCLNREIKRRTKAVGSFPNGQSALMLVCTKLRHVTTTSRGAIHYMNMDHLFKTEEGSLSDITAGWLPAAKRQDFDFAKNYWHYLNSTSIKFY